MDRKGYISINHLCTVYDIEVNFFESLSDHELVLIDVHQKVSYINEADIDRIEKIIRIYKDLQVNLEGIDVILNLLDKVEQRDLRILELENRLNRLKDQE